jgi:hypothetical protein
MQGLLVMKRCACVCYGHTGIFHQNKNLFAWPELLLCISPPCKLHVCLTPLVNNGPFIRQKSNVKRSKKIKTQKSFGDVKESYFFILFFSS